MLSYKKQTGVYSPCREELLCQNSSQEQSGGVKKEVEAKKTSEQVSRDLILNKTNC